MNNCYGVAAWQKKYVGHFDFIVYLIFFTFLSWLSHSIFFLVQVYIQTTKKYKNSLFSNSWLKNSKISEMETLKTSFKVLVSIFFYTKIHNSGLAEGSEGELLTTEICEGQLTIRSVWRKAFIDGGLETRTHHYLFVIQTKS